MEQDKTATSTLGVRIGRLEVDHAKLEEKVDREISGLREKSSSMDKAIGIYSAMFEKNVQSQEKLSGAIDELTKTTSGLQQTLIQLQGDIQRNNDWQAETASNLKKVEDDTKNKFEAMTVLIETKTSKIKDDVKVIDEKGKFDIWLAVKNNFVSIIITIYIIVEMLARFKGG